MLLNTKYTSFRINKGETKWFLINKQRCKINCIDAITLNSSIAVYPNLKIWIYSNLRYFCGLKCQKDKGCLQGIPTRGSWWIKNIYKEWKLTNRNQITEFSKILMKVVIIIEINHISPKDRQIGLTTKSLWDYWKHWT
jgi:hypothetical protein